MIQHLTSRFGEAIDGDISTTETPVMEALISCLAQDICFVGIYDRRLGIILEVELDDDVQMPFAMNTAWHAVKQQFPQDVHFATPQLHMNTYGIFNDRAALWAFVPAEIATPDMMERLANAAFKTLGDHS